MSQQTVSTSAPTINLEAMSDSQLEALKDKCVSLLETRKENALKKFIEDTKKAAKAKGFKVSFEETTPKKRRRRSSANTNVTSS